MYSPWLRLFVAWLAGVFSSGFMPGAPLFVPMLSEAGIYASSCAAQWPCDAQEEAIGELFNNGFLASIACMLPIGLAFDHFGGRFCGIAGAAMVTATSIVFGIGVQRHWDFVLLPMMMLGDIGCMLEGYCFFSLVWELPHHIAFIMSMQQACYASSAGLPFVVEWIMKSCGSSLGDVILYYGLLSTASIVALWFVIPTQQEYFEQAEKVLGMPLSRPTKFDVKEVLGNSLRTLRVHAWEHVQFLVAADWAYAAALILSTNTDLLGRTVLQTEGAGSWFAHVTVTSNMIIAVTLCPLIATIVDRIGFMSGVWFLGSTLVVMLGSCVPSAWVVVPGLFASQLFLDCSATLIFRYFVYFAAPQRLGSVMGLFMGLVSVIGIVHLEVVMSFVGLGVPFNIVVVVSTTIAIIVWMTYCHLQSQRQLPSTVVLLGDDETQLATQFPSCGSIGDVMFITHYTDKDALLARLTSTKLEDLVDLMGRIDPERVAELMEKHPEMQDDAGSPESQLNKWITQNLEHNDGATQLLLPGGQLHKPLKRTACQCYEGIIELIRQKACRRRQSTSAQVAVTPTPDMCRKCAAEIMNCIRQKNKEALRNCLLTADIAVLKQAWTDTDAEMTDEESLKFEKEFDLLIPPREVASLLKERSELKSFVVAATKQLTKRKVNRLRASLGLGRST